MIWNNKEIDKIVVKDSKGEVLAEITDGMIIKNIGIEVLTVDNKQLEFDF